MLAVPDAGERYYSLAFMDAWTNNFAYVGRRATGNKAGRYLVAGPEWSGTTPDVHRLIRAPTHLVWLLGRTLVDGADDLAAATAMMQRYTLTPSGDPRTPSRLAPQDHAVPADVADAATFFEIIRRARVGNAAAARDAPELDALAPLAGFCEVGGDGPPPADQRWPALRAGYAESRRVLHAIRSVGGGMMRGGWSVPPATIGNYGAQYVLRAAVALTGLAALEAAEAMYLSADTDSAGEPLSGTHRYVRRFETGATPPVDAFWSLSMYEVMSDARSFFTENPLDRFALGDRSRHLRYGADRSLEIHLQRDPPDGGRDTNWLPAPPGRMRLTLRAYQPRAELLDGRYTPPPARRVD